MRARSKEKSVWFTDMVSPLSDCCAIFCVDFIPTKKEECIFSEVTNFCISLSFNHYWLYSFCCFPTDQDIADITDMS